MTLFKPLDVSSQYTLDELSLGRPVQRSIATIVGSLQCVVFLQELR